MLVIWTLSCQESRLLLYQYSTYTYTHLSRDCHTRTAAPQEKQYKRCSRCDSQPSVLLVHLQHLQLLAQLQTVMEQGNSQQAVESIIAGLACLRLLLNLTTTKPLPHSRSYLVLKVCIIRSEDQYTQDQTSQKAASRPHFLQYIIVG